MNLYPHHVLIWVSNMDRALHFYTEILGLPLISKSGTFSQIGGHKFWIALHLSSKTVEERHGNDGPIIAFKADNVKEKFEELLKKGVLFYKIPYEAAPSITVAEFKDTEGNNLSISSAD